MPNPFPVVEPHSLSWEQEQATTIPKNRQFIVTPQARLRARVCELYKECLSATSAKGLTPSRSPSKHNLTRRTEPFELGFLITNPPTRIRKMVSDPHNDDTNTVQPRSSAPMASRLPLHPSAPIPNRCELDQRNQEFKINPIVMPL